MAKTVDFLGAWRFTEVTAAPRRMGPPRKESFAGQVAPVGHGGGLGAALND